MRIIYLAIFLHSALVSSRFGAASGQPPLGINCQGSSQCDRLFNTVDSDNLIALMNYTIWYGISDEAVFHERRQIACGRNADWAVGGICLFFQGSIPQEGISGAVLKARISDLTYHGCRYCGSVPVSGDNNPGKAGILTSNYVLVPVCDGLCYPGEALNVTASSPTSAIPNDTSHHRGY